MMKEQRVRERSLARGLRAARAAALALIAVTVYGAAGPPPRPARAEAAEPAPQAASNVDELLVVDCLLPGQVRRLGSRLNFLTARRPIKTAARDCEIRGGEYVSYDRANYATALKVWLGPAQQGDPAAQTYVGEIFEKGLGVPPDYAAAAQWYRRAAEQGYSRAAINLGNLYERGLGVPQDPKQALNWYRRAAGLSDLGFEIASPAPAAAEIQRLRREAEDLRRQLAEKEREVERTQRELDRLRPSLEERRSEADSERGSLGRLRQELEASRRLGSTAAKVRELERTIAEREARLAAKDREAVDLREALARLEKEAGERRREMERLRKQTAAAGPGLPAPVGGAPVIELIEPELVATRDIAVMGKKAVPLQVSLTTLPVVGRVTAVGGLKSLTVNGREEALDSENLFKAQVPLTGPREEVRIVAIDRSGRKSALEFLIVDRSPQRTPAGAAPGAPVTRPSLKRDAFGTYHALVIGSNNYPLLPKLQTAVNDAREVGRILQDEYGFKVTLLLNATRYEMLSALNTLRERLTEKDNLLLYYGGHGEIDKVNQRGYWIPVDGERNSTANWISNVAITDILNAMTVRQLLVVADTCYSGTLTRSSLGQLEAGVSEEERLKVIVLMAQKRSRMVITSGGVAPVLDGVGGPHSVFAQAFIDVLWANLGVLTGQELFRHLRLRVATSAKGQEFEQIPEYAPIKFAGHESGDFVLLRLASN